MTFLEKSYDRKVSRYKMMDKYYGKKGNVIGFEDEWDEYLKKNPLYRKESIDSIINEPKFGDPGTSVMEDPRTNKRYLIKNGKVVKEIMDGQQ